MWVTVQGEAGLSTVSRLQKERLGVMVPELLLQTLDFNGNNLLAHAILSSPCYESE